MSIEYLSIRKQLESEYTMEEIAFQLSNIKAKVYDDSILVQ